MSDNTPPGLPPGPRRLVVIHNPAAGQRQRRRLGAVLHHLGEAGCAIDLYPTVRRGDAEAFAATVSRSACDVVVAAGGDGTVNEVVNGLMAAPGPVPRLAIVPLGTANVLAHEIGLDIRPAAIAAAITHGTPRSIRLGVANSRYFVQMAGVGLDAHVVAHVSLALKRHTGKGAYVAETLVQLFRYGFPTLRVTVDGTVHHACTAVVCNGRYYGGPFIAAPEARLWRGGLEVCLLTGGGAWNAARYGLALLQGRLSRLPDVQVVHGSHILVEGPDGLPVQGDGDIIARLPVAISVGDASLEVMQPCS